MFMERKSKQNLASIDKESLASYPESNEFYVEQDDEQSWQKRNQNFGIDSFIDEMVEEDDLRFINRKVCLRKDSFSIYANKYEQEILKELEMDSSII